MNGFNDRSTTTSAAYEHNEPANDGKGIKEASLDPVNDTEAEAANSILQRGYPPGKKRWASLIKLLTIPGA